MDIRKLQRAIVDGLEDVKAQDIVVFNTEHLSPLFERVIIASGQSNRQTKALASSVRETVKARGFPVTRIEGEDNGEWIIVDCGAAVVHVMQPTIRQYYHLEEIWGGKPVKMALGPAKKAPAARKAPAAKKAAPAKAPTKTPAKAPAKAATKPAAKPATKPVAKPASSGKTTRTGGTVSAAGSKAPAARRPAAKAPAKAPVKAAAKPAARKAPAKR